MKNPTPLFWPSAVFSCRGWMATPAYNGPTDGREEDNTKSYGRAIVLTAQPSVENLGAILNNMFCAWGQN